MVQAWKCGCLQGLQACTCHRMGSWSITMFAADAPAFTGDSGRHSTFAVPTANSSWGVCSKHCDILRARQGSVMAMLKATVLVWRTTASSSSQHSPAGPQTHLPPRDRASAAGISTTSNCHIFDADVSAQQAIMSVDEPHQFLKGHDVCLQARPHQLAVAAGDPFVRIYDRRMLAKGQPPC